MSARVGGFLTLCATCDHYRRNKLLVLREGMPTRRHVPNGTPLTPLKTRAFESAEYHRTILIRRVQERFEINLSLFRLSFSLLLLTLFCVLLSAYVYTEVLWRKSVSVCSVFLSRGGVKAPTSGSRALVAAMFLFSRIFFYYSDVGFFSSFSSSISLLCSGSSRRKIWLTGFSSSRRGSLPFLFLFLLLCLLRRYGRFLASMMLLLF